MEAEYFDHEFDTLVETLMEKHHVPGLSIAVVDNGDVLTKGYGWARLPDVRAGPDTLYYAGSTTKAMLAAAVGCAMDQKDDNGQTNRRLQILRAHRWSTPIKDVLDDDFVLGDESATLNITVEDALSHRTGLAGADLMYGSWMGNGPKGIVRALRYLPKLDAPMRTKWQYNNLMYSVVGDVLHSVTNMEWGDAIRHFIWNPLGMTSTYWHVDEVPDEQRSRMAQGYYWTGKDANKSTENSAQQFIPEPYLDFAGIAPAGSVISSVEDYAKWITELLAASTEVEKTPKGTNGHDTKHGSSILTPALFSELTIPRIFQPILSTASQNAQMSPRGYSLGWFHLPSTAGIHHPVMAHGGGLTGFGTSLYLLPSDDFGVVVMGNTAISSNRIGEAICLELMGRKLGMQNEKKSAFAKSLTVFPPLEEKCADLRSDKNEHSSSGHQLSDTKWADLVQKVAGTYYNAGYGYYSVQNYEGPQAHEKIVYDPSIPLRNRAERDEKRTQARSLAIVPVGHRTWNNRLFLRSLPNTSVEVFDDFTHKRDSHNDLTGFFDLEHLSVHGIPSLETREDEDIKAGSGSSLVLWQSERWCPFGACIKSTTRSAAQDEVQATSDQVSWSLGLRLGNASLAEDGNDIVDWKDKMVWFEKVQA